MKPMPLTDEDLAPLFLPGTIRLPSPFPAVGDLQLVKEGAKYRGVEKPGAVLIVRRRIWPATKVSWTIRVECVSAILLTKCSKLDRATATWLFTPSVPKLKSIVQGKSAKGIVFVPEDAPVLMRIEFGTTASESADYPIPGLMGGQIRGCDPCNCCGCDPCRGGNPCSGFSYGSVMEGEGPDES
jgi:hypothetical protein